MSIKFLILLLSKYPRIVKKGFVNSILVNQEQNQKDYENNTDCKGKYHIRIGCVIGILGKSVNLSYSLIRSYIY